MRRWGGYAARREACCAPRRAANRELNTGGERKLLEGSKGFVLGDVVTARLREAE